MPKAKNTIPTYTVWGDAVDNKNYLKGTDIEVVKDGSKNYTTKNTFVHNRGATPLFHYLNAKGNLGDWYDIEDVTEVVKLVKAKDQPDGLVKVTKKGFTPQQLAEITAQVIASLNG